MNNFRLKKNNKINYFITGNSRKSVRWSAVPVSGLSRLCLKLRGEQGSGPEGVDDLCFHTYGEISPFWAAAPKGPVTYAFTQGKFLLLLRPPRTRYPNSSLEAQISALRPKSQPWGPNLNCQREKILHMCESIGHRPLWDHCSAPPSTSTTTCLSRARLPLTI